MSIIDTHCHVSPYWYEPVEALLQHMDSAGVERAVLVQQQGQYDNDYLLECVRAHPDRLVSVVIVDPAAAEAPERLKRLVDQGAAGLRLRPGDRSAGGDPLAIWRKAAELGVPVTTGSAQVEDLASPHFEELVAALPNLTIIIEHLGWANHPVEEAPPYEQRRGVFALSKYPNTAIKFHGLGEFCKRNMPMTNPFPFKGQVTPVLELALDAFGPERMMWGSDWPPVSSREGYANALAWPRDLLAHILTSAQLNLVFGDNARKVYWYR